MQGVFRLERINRLGGVNRLELGGREKLELRDRGLKFL